MRAVLALVACIIAIVCWTAFVLSIIVMVVSFLAVGHSIIPFGRLFLILVVGIVTGSAMILGSSDD